MEKEFTEQLAGVRDAVERKRKRDEEEVAHQARVNADRAYQIARDKARPKKRRRTSQTPAEDTREGSVEIHSSQESAMDIDEAVEPNENFELLYHAVEEDANNAANAPVIQAPAVGAAAPPPVRSFSHSLLPLLRVYQV